MMHRFPSIGCVAFCPADKGIKTDYNSPVFLVSCVSDFAPRIRGLKHQCLRQSLHKVEAGFSHADKKDHVALPV